MSSVRLFDHVGITVDDLEAVMSFFLELGSNKKASRRSWRATGCTRSSASTTPGSKWSCCKPRAAARRLELSKFHQPVAERGPQAAPTNEFGLRNLAFAVDDIHATVDRLKAGGFELVGGIGEYEDVHRLCCVRGPEGIIVSVAEGIT